MAASREDSEAVELTFQDALRGHDQARRVKKLQTPKVETLSWSKSGLARLGKHGPQ